MTDLIQRLQDESGVGTADVNERVKLIDEAADRLAALREWAVALVAGDDMTQWGSHADHSHGVAVLRIVDGKPNGIWDSRKADWYDA